MHFELDRALTEELSIESLYPAAEEMGLATYDYAITYASEGRMTSSARHALIDWAAPFPNPRQALKDLREIVKDTWYRGMSPNEYRHRSSLNCLRDDRRDSLAYYADQISNHCMTRTTFDSLLYIVRSSTSPEILPIINFFLRLDDEDFPFDEFVLALYHRVYAIDDFTTPSAQVKLLVILRDNSRPRK
jgi:hypothetical protein